MEHKKAVTVAKLLLQYAIDSDYYEFMDTVDDETKALDEVVKDLESGKTDSYVEYLKLDIEETPTEETAKLLQMLA